MGILLASAIAAALATLVFSTISRSRRPSPAPYGFGPDG
jgi:hypothetical protein